MQRKLIIRLFVAGIFFLICVNCLTAKSKTAKKVPPTASVTDKDVIAFADNFEAINEELFSYNNVDEEMNLEDVEKVIGEKEMNKVFGKYGITLPSPRRKMDMIMICYSKLKLEKELANEPAFLQSSIRKMIEKEFEANINPDDEEVVKRNFDYIDEKLAPLFEEE